MTDYISREAALNFETSVECKPERLEAVMEGMAIYGEYLKGLQVVDAVPVVRCADCKWLQCNIKWFQRNMRPDGHLPKGVDEYECRHWCGGCNPTDFCSYGERKDGADNG